MFCGHSAVEPKDREGCLKPEGYHEWHIFRDEHGQLIAWKDDDRCNCGCWDTDDYTQVCKFYEKVESVGAK
jgi:hypothetical protein